MTIKRPRRGPHTAQRRKFQDNEWMNQAACQGKPTEMFFPPRGSVGSPAPYIICEGCPVRLECLEYALTFNLSGIWGGTSGKRRREIKKKRLAA
jgi:WhiB family redox-sensing transcriptional regulator